MLKQGNHIDLEIPIDGLPDMAAVKSAKYAIYSFDRKTEILSKTIGSGITKAQTTLNISITESETKPLNGDYYHELSIVDIQDKPATVLQGNIYFIPTYNNR